MSHFRSEFASDFICCFVDDEDERRDPLLSLDFSGLSVLDALRLFLGAARQAGGGADTDAFAERYCLFYEGVQSHTSMRAACRALVRSYLLLDTALHRGDAKVPMSETAFLSEACRLGREGGAELPPRLLAEAYRSILAIPLPEAPAPLPRPKAAGCGGFGRPVCAGLCCYFCCSDKGGGGGEGGTAPLRAVPASMERHLDPIDVDPMECDLPVVGFRQLSLCKELDETLSQGEACSGEAYTGEACPLGNAGRLSLGGKVHALFDAHRPPGAGSPFSAIDLPPAADGSPLFDDEVCGMAVDEPGGGGGGGGGGAAARKPRAPIERWSEAEDASIRAGVAAHGPKWKQIADVLPGRSDDAVRNRWKRLSQKEHSAAPAAYSATAQHPPSSSSSSSASGSPSKVVRSAERAVKQAAQAMRLASREMSGDRREMSGDRREMSGDALPAATPVVASVALSPIAPTRTPAPTPRRRSRALKALSDHNPRGLHETAPLPPAASSARPRRRESSAGVHVYRSAAAPAAYVPMER